MSQNIFRPTTMRYTMKTKDHGKMKLGIGVSRPLVQLFHIMLEITQNVAQSTVSI
jgi:hypothetical protein